MIETDANPTPAPSIRTPSIRNGESGSRVPVALSIAGSDSGGGAGIQADLKSFSALGVYGATVLTAVTAQNTRQVTAIHELPVDIVVAQLHAVLDDLPVDAIKIGMLSGVAIIEAVAGVLALHPQIPVVLDPVMVAKSGDALLAEDAHRAIRELLCPRALLVTPNLPELAILSGRSDAGSGVTDGADDGADDEARLVDQARSLGARAVLAKGGHRAGGQVIDLLVQGERTVRYSHPRIDTVNTHGTGCSLSAAIAARLASGLALEPATAGAIAWLQRAIGAADSLGIGSGHGPVHHFHAWWSAR